MAHDGIDDQAVAAIFAAQPDPARRKMLALRRLILKAAAVADIGPLIETLKWGEPAYLPAAPRIGTTVRIGPPKPGADMMRLLFHCRTGLVNIFRDQYGEMLTFEGNRAIVLSLAAPLPEPQLSQCVVLALTWHIRRRA